MEPATRTFRGDLAFPPKNKLNHVTRTVKTLSPQREDNGTRQARQAIDPRWDPYSGEITSSDKGKPQSVKPKTFGISLRPVDGRRGKTGDLKTPTPVGERIRKLNSHASSEKLEIKDPLYINSSATSSISKLDAFTTESLPQTPALPSHTPSVKSPAIKSPVIKTPTIKTPVGTTPTESIVKKPEVVESVGSLSQNNTNARIENEVPQSFDNSHEVGVIAVKEDPKGTRNNNNVQPVMKEDLDEEEISITKSDSVAPGATSPVVDKVLSQKSVEDLLHVSAKVDQPSPPVAALEFQKHDPPTPPLINSENTDDMVQPHRPSHINTNISADINSMCPPSSNDTKEQSLIKSRALAQQESLVINRLRPKESATKFYRISRKSVPLSSPIFISMSTPSAMDAKERHLMVKSLPQTPAENSSNDLVTGLQAHLDNLAHRRRNITLSIRQMTELMPRDNLLITDEVRIKREHEKKKIAMLREEEAELKREEHEVGLRLHRAWKRTESGAVYEPTSLWVRRVTGVGKNWCWPNQDLPVF